LRGDLRGRLADPSGPAGPITERGRHPVLRTVAAAGCGCVLAGVGLLGVLDHLGHLALEPLLAPVGVQRGVGGDLGAVDGDRPEPGQAGLRGHQQHLGE